MSVPERVPVISIILLMAVISIPGWLVGGMMSDRGASLFVAISGALLIALVGIAIAIFFGRRGGGKGNRRAAAVALLVAAAFAVILVASYLHAVSRQISTVGAGAVRPEIPWGIVLIGGPALLALGLGWAIWRNRGLDTVDRRRSDRGARELRERLDREERSEP